MYMLMGSTSVLVMMQQLRRNATVVHQLIPMTHTAHLKAFKPQTKSGCCTRPLLVHHHYMPPHGAVSLRDPRSSLPLPLPLTLRFTYGRQPGLSRYSAWLKGQAELIAYDANFHVSPQRATKCTRH